MQCAQRRKLVVNNVRFLVRDRSPNLASKALAKAVEALLGQWREKYGYERKTLGHIVTLCDAANGVPVALAATTQSVPQLPHSSLPRTASRPPGRLSGTQRSRQTGPSSRYPRVSPLHWQQRRR